MHDFLMQCFTNDKAGFDQFKSLKESTIGCKDVSSYVAFT